MEKAYIRRYNNMHIIYEIFPAYEHDYTDNFETQFRPLPEVVAYDAYFVDPQYGFDPYWVEELYDKDKLEYKDTYNKPNDQIECDDLIFNYGCTCIRRITICINSFVDSQSTFT